MRLQKGMFLFSKEAPGVPPGELYRFEPYNYGPMSSVIYGDVDALVAEGLVEEVSVEGQSWSRYRATTEGVELAGELLNEAKVTAHDAARYLFDMKQSVSTKSFDTLLEEVYDRYPDFASASVFARRA